MCIARTADSPNYSKDCGWERAYPVRDLNSCPRGPVTRGGPVNRLSEVTFYACTRDAFDVTSATVRLSHCTTARYPTWEAIVLALHPQAGIYIARTAIVVRLVTLRLLNSSAALTRMAQHSLLLGAFVLTHVLSVCVASSLGYNRATCQYPSSDALDGCPTGTVFVGPSSNYTTIQAAVRSLPNDTSPQTILIASGNYTEQVNITRLGPVTFLGQTTAPNDRTQNTVRVYWAAVAGPSDNARTSTLTVGPADAPYASTDFRVYNMDFINDYAPYSDTPSLALDVNHANASFYYTGFYSYQDTVSHVGGPQRLSS